MVSSILSEADAREVEAAVARVESESAAEVVVAVVPQSQDYWQGRMLLTIGWALAAGLAFLRFEPWREPMLALLIELVVGGAVFALSGLPALRRSLVSEAAASRAVSARAFQLFAERGLYATRGRTALLIFVSELERRVVLLGDHGIHTELGQRGWDEQVKLLLGHIRSGDAKRGLLAVLEELAPHLAAVAPRVADDVNELPDAVLRG
jgi:putative membrane protein